MHVSQINEHYEKYSKYEFILYMITLSYNFFYIKCRADCPENNQKNRVYKILQLNTYLLTYISQKILYTQQGHETNAKILIFLVEST